MDDGGEQWRQQAGFRDEALEPIGQEIGWLLVVVAHRASSPDHRDGLWILSPICHQAVTGIKLAAAVASRR
jgi:hypothetical protein